MQALIVMSPVMPTNTVQYPVRAMITLGFGGMNRVVVSILLGALIFFTTPTLAQTDPCANLELLTEVAVPQDASPTQVRLLVYESGVHNQFVRGNLDLASTLVQELLAVDVTFANAYFYRGCIFRVRDLDEEAIANFEIYVEFSPESERRTQVQNLLTDEYLAATNTPMPTERPRPTTAPETIPTQQVGLEPTPTVEILPTSTVTPTNEPTNTPEPTATIPPPTTEPTAEPTFTPEPTIEETEEIETVVPEATEESTTDATDSGDSIAEFPNSLTGDLNDPVAITQELQLANVIPEIGELAFSDELISSFGEGVSFYLYEPEALDSDILVAGQFMLVTEESDTLEQCSLLTRATLEDQGGEPAIVNYLQFGVSNQNTVFVLDNYPEDASVATLERDTNSESLHLLLAVVNQRATLYVNGEQVITDFQVAPQEGAYAFVLQSADRDTRCEVENLWAVRFSD